MKQSLIHTIINILYVHLLSPGITGKDQQPILLMTPTLAMLDYNYPSSSWTHV